MVIEIIVMTCYDYYTLSAGCPPQSVERAFYLRCRRALTSTITPAAIIRTGHAY